MALTLSVGARNSGVVVAVGRHTASHGPAGARVDPDGPHQPSHLRGLAEVAAASVLWGTGGLAVQLIREHEPLSPVTISAWRMAIAAAVLLLALLALRRGDELVALARARPRQLLAVGVGTAAYQGFYFVSVTQVGVAVSTVVSLGLAPVLLTVAESVRHRRAPAPRAWPSWAPRSSGWCWSASRGRSPPPSWPPSCFPSRSRPPRSSGSCWPSGRSRDWTGRPLLPGRCFLDPGDRLTT